MDLKTLGNVLRKSSFTERKMGWDILSAISCFSDNPREKLSIAFVVTAEVMMCIPAMRKCFNQKRNCSNDYQKKSGLIQPLNHSKKPSRLLKTWKKKFS